MYKRRGIRKNVSKKNSFSQDASGYMKKKTLKSNNKLMVKR